MIYLLELTTGDDAVSVRLLNTTDKACIIRKGTHMAQNLSVFSMNCMQTDKSPKTKRVKARLLKEAHKVGGHRTGQEMRRQKRYHDAKINWQIFFKR
jgi:hypothetical protein